MLGRPLTARLLADGHRVREVSRSSRDFPADVTTGQGLDTALDGVDAVVNATNGPPTAKASPVLVEGTERLLAVTAAHHVCVSIVSIDAVPGAYYRVKLAQEQAVRDSGRPWSVVRATQFHELVAALVDAAARRHVRIRSSARVQPVAASEAAAAVATVAAGKPRRGFVEVAGPEVLTVSALGERGVPVPVPLPGRLGRALRAGGLTTASPDVSGKITWSQWRAAQTS